MRIISKVLVAIISLGIAGTLFAIGSVYLISLDLPNVDTLKDYRPPLSSKVLAKNGEVLLEVGVENREVVALKDIPDVLVKAFVAAEDENFYSHRGIDPQSMLRALIADIKAGGFVQGGSTITQQVAKLLLLNREKSFTRKIKDAILAVEIEKKFSKEQILYFYLNHIYLGSGFYGVKAAARGYYNKDLKDITIAEAALIAGLNVAPTKYSPYRNPRFAKVRQLYVIGRMYETGVITEAQFNEAKTQKLTIQINRDQDFKGGHFTDWVRQRVITLVGEEQFLSGGFTVKTTMDFELQKLAEEKVKRGVKEIDKRQGYKGPIKNLNTDALIEAFSGESRSQIFLDNSTFFHLGENGEIEYEFNFDKKEAEELFARNAERIPGLKGQVVYRGIDLKDKILNLIHPGQETTGTVYGVNDQLKVAFVSIGGSMGVIPMSDMMWAKKRNLSADAILGSPPTQPGQILKQGDVVRVTIVSEKAQFLKDLVAKDIKKGAILPELKKVLEEEKFLHLALDQIPEVEGALVSLELNNNEILALVGGKDFKNSQFNRVLQSNRQPGSAFKPFIFALSLEEGYTAASLLNDTPESLGGVDQGLDWKPRNYDGEFKGPITLRQALQESRNVPTVKLAADLGVDKVIRFIKRMGLNPKMSQDLSVSLGSVGVKLIDLTASYSVFIHQGRRIKPKSILEITDGNGKKVDFKSIETAAGQMMDPTWPTYAPAQDLVTVQEKTDNVFLSTLKDDQVFDPRLAYIMTSILRGVVEEGTGAEIGGLSPFIAGKTGTTNAYNDALFIGFSSKILTGVWTGFDDNQTMGYGETGAKAAMPIWAGFMDIGLKKYGEDPFLVPDGLVQVKIDKKNGRMAGPNSPIVFSEYFVKGTEPGVNETERIQLPTSGNQGAASYEDEDYLNQQ